MFGQMKLTAEHAGERLFTLFGATASAANGSGGNRGYGPLENDQDVPGELFTNPNAATYARGRLFSDRELENLVAFLASLDGGKR